MRMKILILFFSMCIVLGSGMVVYGEEENTSKASQNITENISSGNEDYTPEETNEEETIQHVVTLKYYYVTFVDKVNKTKRKVRVEENQPVEPIKVKKEQIKIKTNTYKHFQCWVDSTGIYYDFRKK